MKTYYAKRDDIQREWFVVDAAGQNLGRLATRIATVLRGKHKPIFTPSMDTGDFVIVVNADKIAVTGRKLDQKMYYRYSGYPGGLTETSLRRMLEANLSATLCTDNRLVSNTSVTRELSLAVDHLPITRRHLRNLVIAGFKGSFFPGTYNQKRAYIRRVIDRYDALEAELLPSDQETLR